MTSIENQKIVVGVFRSRLSADECFMSLLRRGFLSSDISIMMSDQTRARDYAWVSEDAPFETANAQSHVHKVEHGKMSLHSAPLTGTSAGTMAAQGVGVGGSIGTVVGATLAAIAAVGTAHRYSWIELSRCGTDHCGACRWWRGCGDWWCRRRSCRLRNPSTRCRDLQPGIARRWRCHGRTCLGRRCAGN